MKKRDLFLWNVNVEFHNAAFNLFQLVDFDKTSPNNPLIHSHSYYEIYFGINKGFTLSTMEDQYFIKDRSMLVVAPGKYHYRIPTDASDNMVNLSLAVQKIPGRKALYHSVINALQSLNFAPTEISSGLYQSIVNFSQAASSAAQDSCYIKCLAYKLMYDLLHEIHAFSELELNEGHHRNPTSDLIVLEELINTRQFSLKDIAAFLGYSEKQTSRMIYKLFGMSYRELSKGRRIEDIKKLLIDSPSMTIEQISTTVGFTSNSSMYKVFYQSEGCSPMEYRKRMLKKAGAKNGQNINKG